VPNTTTPTGRIDSQIITRDLAQILENMTSDWDSEFDGGIGPETCLIADLGFESIDVVQLVVAIEEHFQHRDLPFGELLMADGRYVDDLSVGNIVNFLSRQLATGN
jgi:acyl carrier protein